MTARRFTATEDKLLVNGRKAGVPWRALAEMLGRDRNTVRNRYDKITEVDQRRTARPPSYCPGPPIPPVFTARPDDSAHVVACQRAGGFTRENQWSQRAA